MTKGRIKQELNLSEQAANPKEIWFSNLLSILLWLLVVVYVAVLLLSAPNWLLPGEPIWAIKPETLAEVAKESLNFFFILPVLSWLMSPLTAVPVPVVHPASEAFFNFAEAWIFMFLPLLLTDSRGQGLPRLALWSAAMFLTNVFLIPYMALRLRKPTEIEPSESAQTVNQSYLSRAFGAVGLLVGTSAIAWFCLARPEFGGLAERASYFVEKIGSDRVTIAFCVDLALFWIFQAWLMSAVIVEENQQRLLRFIPFWGLAIWLIANQPSGKS